MRTKQRVCRSPLALLFICAFSINGVAQWGGLNREHRTQGEATIQALDAITDRPERWTVELLHGDTRRALGTLVSPQGYLVTKASETEEVDTARFQSGVTATAERLQVDPDLDLALFRITTPRVPSVDWNLSTQPEMGQIAIAPDVKRSAKLGVVATRLRGIPETGAALGVEGGGQDQEDQEGARISAVVPDSPAERAELKKGDLVVAVNGRSIRTFLELSATISMLKPGDTALMKILRDEETIAIPVVLGYRAVIEREDRNQQMSGLTSERRTGFERVIQHDIPIPADSLGGPLLNLKGEVLGINIARADRVTTFAIPNDLARESAERMIQNTIRKIQTSVSDNESTARRVQPSRENE